MTCLRIKESIRLSSPEHQCKISAKCSGWAVNSVATSDIAPRNCWDNWRTYDKGSSLTVNSRALRRSWKIVGVQKSAKDIKRKRSKITKIYVPKPEAAQITKTILFKNLLLKLSIYLSSVLSFKQNCLKIRTNYRSTSLFQIQVNCLRSASQTS